MLSIYTYMYQALDVRFIEYMPFNGNRWNLSKFVPYRTMLAKVMGQWEQLVRLKDQPSDTSKVRVHSYVYTCRKERKRVLRLWYAYYVCIVYRKSHTPDRLVRLILICEFGFECMQANEDAILNENINIQNDKSSRIDHRKNRWYWTGTCNNTCAQIYWVVSVWFTSLYPMPCILLRNSTRIIITRQCTDTQLNIKTWTLAFYMHAEQEV